MAFQVLQLASGTVSPLALATGGTWAPYSNNVVLPGFGLFIPSTALANYNPGTSFTRFVQTVGASGPATNGNLVVDVIHNAPTTQGASDITSPGAPVCIVYTIAGGVLT